MWRPFGDNPVPSHTIPDAYEYGTIYAVRICRCSYRYGTVPLPRERERENVSTRKILVPKLHAAYNQNPY